jgi:endonuclease/exonuclease/phosphatase family metal-dependent hydrolase
MYEPVEGDGRTSRRAFLARAAGIVGGVTAAGFGIEPVVATATPTVMTRNVSFGVSLGRLFDADSLEDVRTIAGDILEDVDPSTYEARADAIAGEIAAADADVVALQEAALLRTQNPGDFGSDGSESAETVVVDFLDMIVSALDGRGLDYAVAATAETSDVELPADSPDGPTDVRITDRNVLLVRDDHETRRAATDTYTARIPFPVPGTRRIVELRRGYCRVEVVVEGVPFTAVSTHLESVADRIRAQQAEELLDALPTTQPVVLCGDFNTGPQTNTETYDRLTESFDDAQAALRPERDGFTCCQMANLENDRSRLDSRVDLVLYRGGVRPVDVARVGHRPEDRITVSRDGEQSQLWPSDHAGVVATLDIPEPTPTPRQTAVTTPTPQSGTARTSGATETPTQSPTTQGEAGPGMGVPAAVAGAVGVGLLGISRLLRGDE